MWALPTVVLASRAARLRYAAVMHFIIRLANEYVDIMEAFH